MPRRRRRIIPHTPGGPPSLPGFVFQPETVALSAVLTATPTVNRQRSIDELIRTWKGANSLVADIWTDLAYLFIIGSTKNDLSKNWRDPTGLTLLEVGVGIVFVADDYWSTPSAGNYWRTQHLANELPLNNHRHGVWIEDTTASNNSDYGALNAAAQGVSFIARTVSGANTNAHGGRSGTAQIQTLSPANSAPAQGYNSLGRGDGVNMVSTKNGVRNTAVAAASVAMPAVEILWGTPNSNGVPSANITPRKQKALFAWKRELSAAEEQIATASLGRFLDAIKFGEPVISMPAIGTTTVQKQFVVLDTTAQGIVCAHAAARAGLSVAICAQPRSRHLGGVSGGSLGWFDWDDITKLGGTGRWVVRQCNLIEGRPDTTLPFVSRNFRRAMRRLLDPRTNGGFDIPIYYSDGVDTVAKTGTVVNSFRTLDGRYFEAAQFSDGSYEGDLIRRAGASYILGREPAGAGSEASGGFLGASGTQYVVDPFVTPGVPASGLLPGMHLIRSTFNPLLDTTPAVGSGDNKTQAYTLRLALTNTLYRKYAMSSTVAPPNYSVANYEILLRYLALNPATTMANLFKIDRVSAAGEYTVFDVNNLTSLCPQSTDWIGESWSYPLASYATRELLHKAHVNYILGLLFTLQRTTGADPRVPAALATEARTYGFVNDHWNHHPNDGIFDPCQLYVREGIRLIGDQIANANDADAVDGTAIRISNKTIAVANYMRDSHPLQRIARENPAGTFTIYNEGGMGAATGGVDGVVPIPIELALPKASEITNMSSLFVMSVTHLFNSLARMEGTGMQVGQSMGVAAYRAIQEGVALQSINYPTLRAAILASPSLSGEVASILPQVN